MTTTTAPAVIDALISALNTALTGDAKAFESWPGPDARPRMIFFGETTWDDYEVAAIKSGRKARQENYEITFEVWATASPDSHPWAPKATRDDAYSLLAEMEDILAADPSAAIGYASIQHIQIRPGTARPIEFEKGWAYHISGAVAVAARLN